MITYPISEIFHSVQGEGILAGMPSVFVRLAGCNLNCKWCDTPHALNADQADVVTLNEILATVLNYKLNHVVVTGGEPLLYAALPDLLNQLKEHHKHITVETNGTIFQDIACDLISLSPKLSNSIPDNKALCVAHESKRINVDVLNRWISEYNYQLKFVVATQADVDEIESLLAKLQTVDPSHVLLMPQAQTQEQHQQLAPQVVEYCVQHGFRFCPRLHVQLWGNERKR